MSGRDSPSRFRWLLVGVLLLALSAWLMPAADPTGRTASRSAGTLRFPTSPSGDDYQKMEARRTIPRRVVTTDAGEPVIVGARDPLLLALPSDVDNVAVLEAAAFFRLPVGRMLLECMDADGALAEVESLGLGADDLDRIAFASRGGHDIMMALSGQLGGVRAGDAFDSVAYGDEGHLLHDANRSAEGLEPDQVVEAQPVAGHGGEMESHDHDGGALHHVAMWRDELMILSNRRPALTDALDRLEGRLPSDGRAVAESEAYSEVYGRFGAKQVADMVPESVRARVAESGMRFTFHVDATGDPLVVLDGFQDEDGRAAAGQDVGRTLAGALSVARLQAVASGEHEEARLLDMFSVDLAHNGFQLQAAFPLQWVEEMLASCLERDRDRGVDAPPAVSDIERAQRHSADAGMP